MAPSIWRQEVKHIPAPSSPAQRVEGLEQNGFGRNNVGVR